MWEEKITEIIHINFIQEGFSEKKRSNAVKKIFILNGLTGKRNKIIKLLCA